MKKLELSDVRNLAEYEKVREAERAAVIELKKRRRLALGDNLTLLFENRETVLFQVQEMVRAERIVKDPAIQAELDAYNALLPTDGELSATLFIEIPGISQMSTEGLRRAVNRFQGLEKALRLVVGGETMPGRFEGGHSKEEKMAAVQFVRFAVGPGGREALADASREGRVVVDHPNYKAEVPLPPELRQELVADLQAR